MRLISQTGDVDVPYEITPLSRTGNFIRAYMPMIGEKGTIMAQYSTEEKAIKAMEMLHNTYTGAFFAQNIEVPEDIEKEFMNMAATKGFGIIKTAIDSSDIKFEPANIAFRFPKDDEV